MGADEYARLEGDIKARGQQHPITVYREQILDGRHRYRACQALGIEPQFEPFIGDDQSALAFVIGENLHRRHLSPSQVGMVAAKFAAMVKAEAAERERAGKKPSGDMTGGSGEKGETAVILGNRFGIGETTVRKAVKVREQGTPELVAAVESGTITVNEGARIAKMQPATQRKVVAMADPVARKRRADSASRGNAARRSKPAPTTEKYGTELTRQILGRIEGLWNDMVAVGFRDGGMVADRFCAEFDWKDSFQLRQLACSMEMARAISMIYEKARHRNVA
jgi:hypothetical protein